MYLCRNTSFTEQDLYFDNSFSSLMHTLMPVLTAGFRVNEQTHNPSTNFAKRFVLNQTYISTILVFIDDQCQHILKIQILIKSLKIWSKQKGTTVNLNTRVQKPIHWTDMEIQISCYFTCFLWKFENLYTKSDRLWIPYMMKLELGKSFYISFH